MYKKETTTKKYKVKFHAPNMYDMYSAKNSIFLTNYWLMNSSQEKTREYMVSLAGVVYYSEVMDTTEGGTRVVGYLDKKCKVVSGEGTKEKPYKIAR